MSYKQIWATFNLIIYIVSHIQLINISIEYSSTETSLLNAFSYFCFRFFEHASYTSLFENMHICAYIYMYMCVYAYLSLCLQEQNKTI